MKNVCTEYKTNTERFPTDGHIFVHVLLPLCIRKYRNLTVRFKWVKINQIVLCTKFSLMTFIKIRTSLNSSFNFEITFTECTEITDYRNFLAFFIFCFTSSGHAFQTVA